MGKSEITENPKSPFFKNEKGLLGQSLNDTIIKPYI